MIAVEQPVAAPRPVEPAQAPEPARKPPAARARRLRAWALRLPSGDAGGLAIVVTVALLAATAGGGGLLDGRIALDLQARPAGPPAPCGGRPPERGLHPVRRHTRILPGDPRAGVDLQPEGQVPRGRDSV